MRAQFDQKLLSSFYLWFDDRVVRYGEARETGISQNFYYSENSVDLPANKIAYYSPDRQFVSDGNEVPQGVYIKGGGFGSSYKYVPQQPDSATGLIIDHDQGRVILNSSVGTGLSISGSFSRQTMNTYITNESEEELLLNTDFLLADQDDQTFLESITGFASLNYTVPACFISYNSSLNKPFALGGLQDTRSNIRAVVVANDNYSLDSTLSLFRDSAEVCVPIVDYAEFPYGEFFHVKNPPYSYETLYNQKMDAGARYSFIDKINVSKLRDTSSSAINLPRNMRIGFIDFQISTPRMPKIELGSPTSITPVPPPPLDEVEVTIEGEKPTVMFQLPEEFFAENRSFSSFSIKNNDSFNNSQLHFTFPSDPDNKKPDSFTPSALGEKISVLQKFDEYHIMVGVVGLAQSVDPLYQTSSVTFTLQYF